MLASASCKDVLQGCGVRGMRSICFRTKGEQSISVRAAFRKNGNPIYPLWTCTWVSCYESAMFKKLLPFLLALVPGFIDRGLALSDYHNATLSIICWGFAALILAAATINAIHEWHFGRLAKGKSGVQASHLLLVGLAGAWLSLTAILGATAWIVLGRQGFGSNAGQAVAAIADSGPIQWYRNIILEGGPPAGANVMALTFNGLNISQSEVELKSASIISAVNGIQIPLEIVAQGEVIPLDQVGLVPPGAPIQLVAKFGPPDPAAPGKILGIDSKKFVDAWRQFSLNVEDSSKTYRVSFTEGDLAPFFPGVVGPHVSKKTAANDSGLGQK